VLCFSPTKIDVWLNGQAFFGPVFKWCLSDLKMNLSDKSYSRVTMWKPCSDSLTGGNCFESTVWDYQGCGNTPVVLVATKFQIMHR